MLPLQVFQTEDEETFTERLPARVYSGAIDLAGDTRARAGGASTGGLRPRLFNLRAIAGRLLGGG